MAAFVVSAAEQVSAGDEAAVEAEAVEASEAAVEEVAEAAEVVAVACPLLEMSYDELSVLTHALCDPLRPQLALQLSSVASGLRAPMQAGTAPRVAGATRGRSAAGRAVHTAGAASPGPRRSRSPSPSPSRNPRLSLALCTRQSGLPWSCADLRDAEQLLLGEFHGRPLSSAHWRTLGNLAARQCLRTLGTLVVIEDSGNPKPNPNLNLNRNPNTNPNPNPNPNQVTATRAWGSSRPASAAAACPRSRAWALATLSWGPSAPPPSRPP